MKDQETASGDFDFNEVGFDFEEKEPVSQSSGDGFGTSLNESANERERSKGATKLCYHFYPTWRSQFWNICAFLVLVVLTIVASRYVPQLVLVGPLFNLGVHTYYLYLPVLIILPAFMLGKIFFNIYNSKFVIDEEGVEAQIGLVSFNFKQPRLRWEDIRGAKLKQTLWERFLGIGSLEIGSAMTQDVEIEMIGVANPRAIQLLVDGERKKRLERLRGGAEKFDRAMVRD